MKLFTYLCQALVLTVLIGCGSANPASDCPSGLYGTSSDGLIFDSGTILMGDLNMSNCLYSGTYTCDSTAKTLSLNINHLESGSSCVSPSGQSTAPYSYSATSLNLVIAGQTFSWSK